jgi:hypothetical protein
VIVSLAALAVAIATLIFAIRNGRKTKQLQRQTWADISLAQIYNSRTRYYQQRTAELQGQIRDLTNRRRR